MSMKEWPKLFFKNPFSREEKKMSKRYEFKVGDKVRVRDWADMVTEYGTEPITEYSTVPSTEKGITSPIYFAPEMRKFCGKVYTVRDIDAGIVMRLSEIDKWVFGREHLILVESAQEKEPEPKVPEAKKDLACSQLKRIASLEEEVAKLRQDPYGVLEDKTKPQTKALKPILPRAITNASKSRTSTADNAEELEFAARHGWTDSPSILNWHHWSGGKRPVSAEKWVVVYLRSGALGVRKACDYYWHHESCVSIDHILAYAIVEPPKL